MPPRAGRALEELVARLEFTAAKYPVSIESPAMLPGKHGGKPREVDVAMRGAIGTLDLLVIFECRDRKPPADVTWIEQLRGKAESVGAQKVVAVSSSGFTEGARTAARDWEIECRTLASIDDTAVWSWIGLSHLTVELPRYDVQHTEVLRFPTSPSLTFRAAAALSTTPDPYAPIWHLIPEGGSPSEEGVSLEFMLNAIRSAIPALAQGEDRRVITLRISTPETPTVAIEALGGPTPLALLTTRIAISRQRFHVRPSKRSEYRDDNGVLSQAVEFEFDAFGSSWKAIIAKTGDAVAFGIEQVDAPTDWSPAL
jgi:hypothetical protein